MIGALLLFFYVESVHYCDVPVFFVMIFSCISAFEFCVIIDVSCVLVIDCVVCIHCLHFVCVDCYVAAFLVVLPFLFHGCFSLQC